MKLTCLNKNIIDNLCKWRLLVLLLALYVSFPISDVKAQTLTENISLSFGKVVLTDNSSSHRIILLSSGGFTADPQYIFFSEPRLANVTVDGYPPSTPLTVSVGTTNLNKSGGGSAFFFTSDVFTNPAIIVTDSFGSATFDVGATLSSNGSGSNFVNNNYQGNYTVTVSP